MRRIYSILAVLKSGGSLSQFAVWLLTGSRLNSKAYSGNSCSKLSAIATCILKFLTRRNFNSFRKQLVRQFGSYFLASESCVCCWYFWGLSDEGYTLIRTQACEHRSELYFV